MVRLVYRFLKEGYPPGIRIQDFGQSMTPYLLNPVHARTQVTDMSTALTAGRGLLISFFFEDGDGMKREAMKSVESPN